jgi:hypothetical protein
VRAFTGIGSLAHSATAEPEQLGQRLDDLLHRRRDGVGRLTLATVQIDALERLA